MVCDSVRMTAYHVRFEGPAPLVLSAVTALADAAGVELISSGQPAAQGEVNTELEVTVQGSFDDVADAVATIRSGLPPDASVEITGGEG